MKVIMTGGGTGGHIYPAIAIADKIKEKQPDAEILFVGTKKGLEKTLVPGNGYPIEFITVSGFDRRNMLKNIKTAADLVRGLSQAKKIIKSFKPDVVIGTGGYVCGPVVKTAAKMGVRTYIHEQNAFPGMTNKMLEPYVDKVFMGFEKAGEYFKHPEKHIVVGNPVRKSFFTKTKQQAREALGIAEDEFMILSFGGSRGAGRINKAMLSVLKEVNGMDKTSLYFGTGDVYYDVICHEAAELCGIADNVHIMRYIDDMDNHLMAADVVVSRAGALSIAEICVCGKCAVFIPSPNVTGNHQYHNAKAVADRGGAFLIEEKDLTDELLVSKLMELKNDPEKVKTMGQAAKKCAFNDSAETIYETIFK